MRPAGGDPSARPSPMSGGVGSTPPRTVDDLRDPQHSGVWAVPLDAVIHSANGHRYVRLDAPVAPPGHPGFPLPVGYDGRRYRASASQLAGAGFRGGAE